MTTARKTDKRDPLESELDGNLRPLRTRGFASPYVHDLSALLQVARTLGHGATDHEKIEAVLALAIGDYFDEPKIETMHLWFGLHPKTQDTRGLSATKRHEVAWKYARAHDPSEGRELEGFRTHGAQEHFKCVARHLFRRYLSATSDRAQATTDEGSSEHPVISPALPATLVEQDGLAQETIGKHGAARAQTVKQEIADDTKLAEPSEATPSPRPHRRLQAIAITTTLLLLGGIAMLLMSGETSSAHHHLGTKTFHKGIGAAPFSPNRPTYDYDVYDPNNNNCGDLTNPGTHFGRCGAMTGHVLDSFINTPSYGDERYFFGARLSTQRSNVNNDPLTHVTIGSTVVLYVYVDNDTAVNLLEPGSSDTHNTRVRVDLHSDVYEPGLNEWVLQPEAFISASNAQTVEDGVNLVGPEPFALQYEAGSAQLLRNNASYPLSNGIVGDQGAPVGLLYMNGDLPAGNNFDAAGYVELHAKVVSAAPPEIRIVNQVRMAGSTNKLTHILYARPGDDVEWLLHTTNGDWSQVNNVVMRDVLPPHLRLDVGSVTYTADSKGTLGDSFLFGGGYNLGNYARGAGVWVTFKTHILGDFTGCSDIVRNIGLARSDQTPVEVTDDADVVIRKPNCTR